eukprot:g75993.t1
MSRRPRAATCAFALLLLQMMLLASALWCPRSGGELELLLSGSFLDPCGQLVGFSTNFSHDDLAWCHPPAAALDDVPCRELGASAISVGIPPGVPLQDMYVLYSPLLGYRSVRYREQPELALSRPNISANGWTYLTLTLSLPHTDANTNTPLSPAANASLQAALPAHVSLTFNSSVDNIEIKDLPTAVGASPYVRTVTFFTKAMFETPAAVIKLKLQPEDAWFITALRVEVVKMPALHVGWILPSFVNETSWAYLHEEGRMYINAIYSPAVRTFREEGVYSATENITYPALYRLIDDKGCTLIICSGMEFKTECETIARQHPHINVVVLSTLSSPGRFEPRRNIAQITGKMWEAIYFTGLVAGSVTKSQKIGYIQTLLHPTAYAFGNAFWFGVQQTCQSCKIHGYYLDDFRDGWRESNAAKDLMAMGCDVMLSTADGPEPTDIFANAGDTYFAIAFMADDWRERVATSTQYNWGPIVAQQIEKLLTGLTVGPPSGINLRGLKYGAVTLGQISPVVEQTFRNKYAAEMNRVLTSEYPEPVFCREEQQWLLNNGTVLWPSETYMGRHCLSEPQRLTMDWFMHGVEWLGYYEGPPLPVPVPEKHFEWQIAFYVLAAVIGALMLARLLWGVCAWRHGLVTEKKKAEERNMATSHFLTNMNHELRTPLNGLFGGIASLRYSGLDEEQNENLMIIERSAEGLLTVVSNVLDLTSMQEGALAVQEEEVILLEAMQESIYYAHRSCELFSPKSHVNFYIDHAVSMVVLGDYSRILQILTNLLGNAFKFTEGAGEDSAGKGKILVLCSLVEADRTERVSKQIESLWFESLHNEKGDNRAFLSSGKATLLEQKLEVLKPRLDSIDSDVQLLFGVCDSGIGMDQEMQEKLFVPFTQADTSNERKHSGSGLGLAVCRELALLLQGQIWVHSRKGEGACFFLSLPYKPKKAANLSRSGSPERSSAAAKVPKQGSAGAKGGGTTERPLERQDFQSENTTKPPTWITTTTGEDGELMLPTDDEVRKVLLEKNMMISLANFLPRKSPVLLLSTDAWSALCFVKYLQTFNLEAVVQTVLSDGLLADLARLKEFDYIFIDHEHPPPYLRSRTAGPAQRTSVMIAEQLRFGGVQAKLCLLIYMLGREKQQTDTMQRGNFAVFHGFLHRPLSWKLFLAAWSELVGMRRVKPSAHSVSENEIGQGEEEPASASPFFRCTALARPLPHRNGVTPPLVLTRGINSSPASDKQQRRLELSRGNSKDSTPNGTPRVQHHTPESFTTTLAQPMQHDRLPSLINTPFEHTPDMKRQLLSVRTSSQINSPSLPSPTSQLPPTTELASVVMRPASMTSISSAGSTEYVPRPQPSPHYSRSKDAMHADKAQQLEEGGGIEHYRGMSEQGSGIGWERPEKLEKLSGRSSNSAWGAGELGNDKGSNNASRQPPRLSSDKLAEEAAAVGMGTGKDSESKDSKTAKEKGADAAAMALSTAVKASQRAKKKADHAKRALLRPDLRQVSVLVVDDNRINRSVLTKMLKQMGIASIKQAEDGAEALTAATSQTFHVIFMDLQMPVMDGFNSTKAIRAKLPLEGLPVIVPVTGNCTDKDREGCREAKMDGFIEKPITAEIIRGTLEKYLPNAIERLGHFADHAEQPAT